MTTLEQALTDAMLNAGVAAITSLEILRLCTLDNEYKAWIRYENSCNQLITDVVWFTAHINSDGDITDMELRCLTPIKL